MGLREAGDRVQLETAVPPVFGKEVCVRFCTLLLIGALVLPALTVHAETGPLVIFHAGSLTVPLDRLTEAFRAEYPSVSFASESSGSRTAARKVSELGREADIVMSADYTVIDELLIPEFADWNIAFARNTMVIAYTEGSAYADEITPDNWYEIITRPGVLYGHSDPDADPCGYRALMVWQLAELHYGIPGLYERLAEGCPPANVRPKAVELIALLQSGNMDYAFEYRSVAVQHDLRFVELPDAINLSRTEYAEFYAEARVEVSGTGPGTTIVKTGKPIVYGLTVPKDAPHPELAVQFIAFVLGPKGQEILADLGQPPIVPAVVEYGWEDLPESLRGLTAPEG